MKSWVWPFAVLLSGGVAIAQTATTAPDGGELIQSRTAMAGNGAERYRLINEKDEIVSVLHNGLTVIVKRMATPVVAVRGVVGTGGVYEGKWLGGGLSHLLEHLVAGGSSDRRTEAENRNLLQQIGNNSNAYTTEASTAFFVNTTTPHMEQAVDLVTGWMLGAKITPAEYRREYQVVQRELEMGKGEPDRQFYYMAAMNRYRVSPARVPVIGYQEVIQGLSRDDVFNYYKMAYSPENIVFCVVGDLDPELMLATVRKYVLDAKPERVFSHDIAAEPPVESPRTLVATFPKLGQARLMLGFPSVKLDHPDLYAMDLLATILGSGESSVLVQELRDQKQLVSAVGANDDTPTYVEGTFGVEMQLDPDKVEPATKAALEIFERVKNEPIDAERIARAKAQTRVARVKSMQTAEQVCASLSDDFITEGDPHFQDKYVQRIEAVTAEQLQEVAKKYFDRQRLLTTLLLPAEAPGSEGLAKAEDVIRPAAPTTAAKNDVAGAGEIQKSELENGTVLLVKRMTSSPLVVMQMYSLGGVTAENEKTNGLGNLTMRMLSRGTSSRNAQQIAEFFDSVGGELDCACGNNSWYATASCLKDDFAKTLEVYGDVLNHPAFPEAELGAMKQRIDAAISEEDADWSHQAIRFFKKEFFGPTHSPYQFLPIGTKENVDGFSREQVQDWYEKHVMGSRRVLAIFGDVNVDQAKSLAEKYLGGGTTAAPVAAITEIKSTTTSSGGPSVDVTDVKVQQTQQGLAGVVIGFKSKSVIGDPGNFILDVGQTMAGGWGYPTGYLFETLRGRGLVYVVQATNNPGRSAEIPGNFFVFAGCDPSKVNEVVDQCLLNIARLQGTAADMQEDWFARSKLLITTADALDNETPAQQARTASLDELFGLGYGYHAHFADRINAVKLEQVRAEAAGRLRECLVTVSTPDPEAVKVEKGVRTYETFPTVDLTPRGVQHDVGAAKP